MAKYGTGELVRFKASELLVSAGVGCTVIGTDRLVGKITGSVETTGEETKYYVEVKLTDGTFVGVSDVALKLTVLESQIMTTSEYGSKVIDDIMKKAGVPYAFNPLSAIEARFNNSFFGVDLGVAGGDKSVASVVDKKMSKSRCVKLLESYRAEREKVKKGRKFERCLRDSVVDEALERAIELLKE